MAELTEQAKKLRAEYHREWRKKNPDKCRKYREKYWNKKAAEETSHQEQE